jgi:hypothetical protein
MGSSRKDSRVPQQHHQHKQLTGKNRTTAPPPLCTGQSQLLLACQHRGGAAECFTHTVGSSRAAAAHQVYWYKVDFYLQAGTCTASVHIHQDTSTAPICSAQRDAQGGPTKGRTGCRMLSVPACIVDSKFDGGQQLRVHLQVLSLR